LRNEFVVILLLDIGNTNTHLGLASRERVVKQANIPTRQWFDKTAGDPLARFVGSHALKGAALCSVVPKATSLATRGVASGFKVRALQLNAQSICGIGVDYPKPSTIGPDRLANAIAACHHYGAPSIVVDFGTAVTFDVVDRHGNYVGGIIAPGLSAMTDYLHEKTALLPRIKVRAIKTVVGKSTEQAMLVGAVHGYRGLIAGLIRELKTELKAARLPVIATGGYARLISDGLPAITAVDPLLTLEGLRLFWLTAGGLEGQNTSIRGNRMNRPFRASSRRRQ
jgi:type III pantothenate kinase